MAFDIGMALRGLLLLGATAAGQAQPSIGVRLMSVRDVTYAWYDVPTGQRLSIRVTPAFSTRQVADRIRCGGVSMTGVYTRRNADVPDGLVVIDGRTVGRDNGRNDGGIVSFAGGSAMPVRTRDHRRRPSQAAVQAFVQPILIFGGAVENDLRRPERANRIALGKYQDGRLFMVMAKNRDRSGLSAVTLGQFARDVMATAPKRVDWLANFDGGPSAFLHVLNGMSVVPASGKVTSYVCAEPNDG